MHIIRLVIWFRKFGLQPCHSCSWYFARERELVNVIGYTENSTHWDRVPFCAYAVRIASMILRTASSLCVHAEICVHATAANLTLPVPLIPHSSIAGAMEASNRHRLIFRMFLLDIARLRALSLGWLGLAPREGWVGTWPATGLRPFFLWPIGL